MWDEASSWGTHTTPVPIKATWRFKGEEDRVSEERKHIRGYMGNMGEKIYGKDSKTSLQNKMLLMQTAGQGKEDLGRGLKGRKE